MTLNLFSKETFTSTEANIIGECFDNPTVRKYLNNELIQSFAAIAESEPAPGESAEEYLRRAAKVQGCIQVFKALLSIKKAPTESEQQQ